MRCFMVTPTALKQIFLTAFILSLTVAGCAITEKADTTSTEQVLARNKEQVRRFYAAFSTQDLEKASQLITPNFGEMGSNLQRSSETNKDGSAKDKGIDFLRPKFKMLRSSLSEFEITPGEMVAEGNIVAVLWSEDGNILPGVLPEKEGPGPHRFVSSGCSFYKLTEQGLIDGVLILTVKDKIVSEAAEKGQARNEQ